MVKDGSMTASVFFSKEAADKITAMEKSGQGSSRSNIIQSLILSAPEHLPEYVFKLVQEPRMIQGVPWSGIFSGVIRILRDVDLTNVKVAGTCMDVYVSEMSFSEFAQYVWQIDWPT